MKRMALVFACSAVTACSSSTYSGFSAEQEDPKKISVERQNELIAESLQSCYDFFGVKSVEAEKKAKSAWRWTLAGLVSGAVVAPALTAANAAANATWISAFSGFSGVSAIAVNNANGLGIGPASSVDGLVVIGNAVRADMVTAANRSLEYPVRAEAAARASVSCTNPATVGGYIKAQVNAEQQKLAEAHEQQVDAQIKALSETVKDLQKKQAESDKPK
jgi:hypothetical protein